MSDHFRVALNSSRFPFEPAAKLAVVFPLKPGADELAQYQDTFADLLNVGIDLRRRLHRQNERNGKFFDFFDVSSQKDFFDPLSRHLGGGTMRIFDYGHSGPFDEMNKAFEEGPPSGDRRGISWGGFMEFVQKVGAGLAVVGSYVGMVALLMTGAGALAVAGAVVGHLVTVFIFVDQVAGADVRESEKQKAKSKEEKSSGGKKEEEKSSGKKKEEKKNKEPDATIIKKKQGDALDEEDERDLKMWLNRQYEKKASEELAEALFKNDMFLPTETDNPEEILWLRLNGERLWREQPTPVEPSDELREPPRMEETRFILARTVRGEDLELEISLWLLIRTGKVDPMSVILTVSKN